MSGNSFGWRIRHWRRLRSWSSEGGLAAYRRIGVPMKPDLFEELRESVREGGAILRGHRRPSRASHFGEPDVRAVRKSYRLSQSRFAALIGISPATLRNWEQGRRKPEGSARILLRIVARHPEAVLDVVIIAQPAPGAGPDMELRRASRSHSLGAGGARSARR